MEHVRQAGQVVRISPQVPRWPAPGVVIGGIEHLATGPLRAPDGTVVKLRCGALYQMAAHRKTIVGRCAICFGRSS